MIQTGKSMSPQTPAGQILGGSRPPATPAALTPMTTHALYQQLGSHSLGYKQFQDPRSIFPGIVAGNITAYSTAVALTVVSMPYTALQRY